MKLNEKIATLLMGGGIHEDEQNQLMELSKQLEELKSQNNKKDEIIQQLNLTKEEQQKDINNLKEELANQKKKPAARTLESYDLINLQKFLKTEDYKLINPEIYEYDDELSAFDKNSKIDNYYRDYQKQFITDWSLSSQELVILYYGVGSGKTMIAVNCAEQFATLNNDSHVYFLVPASLVLPTIKEMFSRGIDPTRKDKNGQYIYYFLSYQQLLRSKFDFKNNSLLILDEAHNLRNLRTKQISEKLSARKFKKIDNYSLVGNKLAEKLIMTSAEFLRSIFMTGTLFVNSPEDIETIISIGYKKAPLLNMDKLQYEIIQSDETMFDRYYEGLISFYRIPSDAPQFPTKVFHFIPIVYDSRSYPKDPYFINTRTDAARQKCQWILNFILNHKNEKTLIYSQFLDKSIRYLTQLLDKNNIKYGVVNGSYNMLQKMHTVHLYNSDQIKVLIFTLSIKEGISFLETNNFIAIEPYWNYAIFEQILARGIRLNSHKLGKNTNINLYFLIGMDSLDVDTKRWVKNAKSIFDKDIKKLNFPFTKDKEGLEVKDYSSIQSKSTSRDIDMFFRMFGKQENINIFESKLLKTKSFELCNNVENNEFIEIYNMELLKKNADGKILSNRQQIMLKKDLYNNFYKESINNIRLKFTKFNEDSRYKANRNPDLEEKINNTTFKDSYEKIKKLLKMMHH